ncbi:hypothetical protein [Thalassospira mesophila]|uniref:Uncharacterized protein n=1 Tax=Thalassospira mesophila TaxID=1293891 RepID=A0A1Y2L4B3_9PROT|nr:hypothetical protein [Thalassospira mesophila]OSQ39383.1 hypothetical protein TMES_04750 [Thalassospira mesophila]
MAHQDIGPNQHVTIRDAVRITLSLQTGNEATITAQQNNHSKQYSLSLQHKTDVIQTDEAGPIEVSMAAEFGSPQVRVAW